MDLTELKNNKEYLLATLGVKDSFSNNMYKCPFHEDKNPSLHVFQSQNKAWIWKCHTGCGAGTIIDAAIKKWACDGPVSAMKRIEEELGIKIFADDSIEDPVLDMGRVIPFLKLAQKGLFCEEARQYWEKKRGFKDLDCLSAFGVGFISDHVFNEWNHLKFTGWVFPITNRVGSLSAVKMHLEKLPWPNGPKSLWCPFGTIPEKKPKHGLSTLWPRPEVFHSIKELVDTPEVDEIYLTPGELKALTMISVGDVAASSITVGEGSVLSKTLIMRLKRNAKRVIIVYDNDKAGLKWLDSTSQKLSENGVSYSKITFKR